MIKSSYYGTNAIRLKYYHIYQKIILIFLEKKSCIDKVWLQILLKKINMAIYFENPTVKLHARYVFNTQSNFHAN